jgi:hypothetical protein
VFSAWFVQSGYKKVFGSKEEKRTVFGNERSAFETPACRDMIFGAEKLN